jgi:ABC-type multidrug transport system fused ATPase/permease subunit
MVASPVKSRNPPCGAGGRLRPIRDGGASDGHGREIARFDNVGLRYGTDREVLSDVGFTLHAGHFYFLTGPAALANPRFCACSIWPSALAG